MCFAKKARLPRKSKKNGGVRTRKKSKVLQAQEERLLSASIKVPDDPPASIGESFVSSRQTRSSGPMRVPCIHCGLNQESQFPGFFFCHPCKMKDGNSLCGTKRWDPSSVKYACIANHTSWTFPTHKKQNAKKYDFEVAFKQSRPSNKNEILSEV